MKIRSLPSLIPACYALAAWLVTNQLHAQLPMPALKVPDGIGVSIHFTNPKTSEMQAMSDAGIRWLRTDLTWNATETIAGLYNFSQYDALVTAADQYGMKIVFILDYTNPLYDGGYSPSTPAGRQAFANWAVAAVARYQGRGYIWEVYNEPNLPFWTSSSTMTVAQKASAYSQLALKVCPTIRSAFPNERLVGPSPGYFDGWNANFPATTGFLQTCIQQGLAGQFDGITVHPYRTVEPENVWPDYNMLQGLIHNSGTSYNTTGKYPPILSGEWGYSATWFSGDQVKKAKFISRSILHNYLCGIPLSIIYDWSNDGTDPNNMEHNFGLVGNYNHGATNPVISPLAAYQAVKTINLQLGGYTFAERINTGDGTDFVLKFTKDNKARYVAWTEFNQAHAATIPCAPSVSVAITSYDGGWTGTYTSGTSGGFYCGLTDAPQFIIAVGQ